MLAPDEAGDSVRERAGAGVRVVSGDDLGQLLFLAERVVGHPSDLDQRARLLVGVEIARSDQHARHEGECMDGR